MKDLDSLPKLRIKGVIAPYDPSKPYGTGFSSDDVINFMDENPEATDIVVEIDSNGGSISEGKVIYNRLRQSGKNITTVTLRAQSIATLFMLTGKKRLIAENADFRIHQGRVYGEDLVALGPLLSEDLFEIGKEVAMATTEILDIYCQVLGEDKRSKFISEMSADKNIGAHGAIKLGFANGYYKKAVQASELGGFLITDHLHSIIKNQQNMKDTIDPVKTLSDKMEAGFKKFAQMLAGIKADVKNQVTLTLSSGGQVYAEPVNVDAPDDLMGAKVFAVDDAGVPTTNPVEDGEYILDDGRTLVVASGVVTEVKTSVDAEALKAENEALKAEVETLKAAQATQADVAAKELATVKAESKKELDALQMSFREFKNQVPGLKQQKDEPAPDAAPKKGLSINDIRTQMEQSKLNIA